VLDQGEVGKQASGAASGLLAPIKPFTKKDDLYTLLLLSCLALFPELVHELQEVTGLCIGYKQTGTLRFLHAKKRSRLEQWVIAWQQAGFEMAILSDDDILRYESGVATTGVVGLYNPHEPQLDATQFMQAYAHAGNMLGAIFYPGEEVIAVERQGTRVKCVHTAQGQSFFCNHVILATGAWSAACGEWLGIRIPVRPLRGQNIAISQPSIPLQHSLFGEGVYLAPKGDELLVVGTVLDDAGFATEITPEGTQWLCDAARKVVPALAACPIQYAWAGLLPKTPDARPILGAAPTWDNVTLACGHNGFGLLLAPVGDLIAEYIVSGHMPASLKPFGLERF
ncbi:MAG: NAD(P)/FAD-dependent oxidoreductase, partial [Ktedonobacteraceae bacterium]